MRNRAVRAVGYVTVSVFMLLGIVLLSGGCAAPEDSLPPDDIYSTIAYYRPDEAGNCCFMTDDSLSLRVYSSYRDDFHLNDTSRYLLYFNILGDAGDTVMVDLMDVQEVYVSAIRMGQVPEGMLAESDEVTPDAFWCSGKYLNMMYSADECDAERRKFEAVCPDSTMVDVRAEVLDLYIMYRSGGDRGNSTGACSFDMSDVLGTYPNVVTFRVMMKDREMQYVDVVRPGLRNGVHGFVPAVRD